MQEFIVLIRKPGAPLFPTEAEMKKRFIQRSLLDENDKWIIHSFESGYGLILIRHRFDYQGYPFYSDQNGFTVLIGYLIAPELGHGHVDFAQRLHTMRCALPTDSPWIEQCYGEFLVIGSLKQGIRIWNSAMLTHQVYYREDEQIIAVSNRVALLSCWNEVNPSYDIYAQLQIIAFDSLFENRTAFDDIQALGRSQRLVIEFRPEIRLCLISITDPWKPTRAEAPHLEESLEFSRELAYYLVDRLTWFSRQVRIDHSLEFNLSGGKDSRLLFLLFQQAGLWKYFKHVLTLGDPDDAEVLAARAITTHYGIPHKIQPRIVPATTFFEKLPRHIFQMEGEINCRVLHGNYKSLRPIHFTGHEAGLRESFVNSHLLHSQKDVFDYIKKRMPIDPIGFIDQTRVEELRAEIRNVIAQALDQGVRPSDGLNWFSIVGRGSRWVGKLTSMSSPSGMYVNPLCDTNLCRFAHQVGVSQRHMELIHFLLFMQLDPGILQFPFAHQEWDNNLHKHFGQRVAIAQGRILGPPQTILYSWWDRLYEQDNREFLIRVIHFLRHPKLETDISYDRLFNYIRSTKNPSGRAMLSIFAVISSSLLLHARELTINGLSRMQQICAEVELFANNTQQVQHIHKQKIVYEGYVDSLAKRIFKGWVWSPKLPSTRLTVQIYYDNKLIGEGIASLSRPDVAKTGRGDGCYGFSISHQPVKLIEASKISIRVKDSDFELKRNHSIKFSTVDS